MISRGSKKILNINITCKIIISFLILQNNVCFKIVAFVNNIYYLTWNRVLTAIITVSLLYHATKKYINHKKITN